MKNKKSTKLVAAFAVVIVALLLAALVVRVLQQRAAGPALPLDSFAQCLTDSGVVVYGDRRCPVCQEQEAMFGDSWRFIRYVECPEEPQVCTAAGVRGVPAWIFADGTKKYGELSLEELAEASGCVLPTQP